MLFPLFAKVEAEQLKRILLSKLNGHANWLAILKVTVTPMRFVIFRVMQESAINSSISFCICVLV